MPNEQQDFYTQLKEETERKVQIHQEFQNRIDDIKSISATQIKNLQIDMKAIAKQIKSNNQLLKERGQEIVRFGE